MDKLARNSNVAFSMYIRTFIYLYRYVFIHETWNIVLMNFSFITEIYKSIFFRLTFALKKIMFLLLWICKYILIICEMKTWFTTCNPVLCTKKSQKLNFILKDWMKNIF